MDDAEVIAAAAEQGYGLVERVLRAASQDQRDLRASEGARPNVIPDYRGFWSTSAVPIPE
jgi:hypothetical protein